MILPQHKNATDPLLYRGAKPCGATGICEREMAKDAVRRLVDALLPSGEIGDYQSRFDDLAETVSLDFGIDIEDLRGLGTESLRDEISEAIITRFGDAETVLGARRYTRLAKTMALQVSDGLWSEHLDLVQDLIVNAQLSMTGHNSAVAELVFRAEDAYRKFMEQASDAFVSRLATFEAEGFMRMTVDRACRRRGVHTGVTSGTSVHGR